MGFAKRQLEELEAQSATACEIAIEAGVLKRCENHEDVILEGSADIEDAYKLGNAKLSSGKLGDLFKTPRELTDAIKSAVEENCADECYSCRKWREE